MLVVGSHLILFFLTKTGLALCVFSSLPGPDEAMASNLRKEGTGLDTLNACSGLQWWFHFEYSMQTYALIHVIIGFCCSMWFLALKKFAYLGFLSISVRSPKFYKSIRRIPD